MLVDGLLKKAQYVKTNDQNGERVKQQKWYLQMTVSEPYQLFKEQNLNIKVSKSAFYSLHLALVVSKIPYSTCHCKYYKNFFL